MNKIMIRAVGDNLIHKQLYTAAEKTDGSYDFSGMYSNVEHLIKEADVSVVNQETILVNDHSKISSFPAFGSPIETGKAIAEAGFDVVTHASNHALDKGYEGIEDSVKFWRYCKIKKVLYTGIHTSKNDQDKIRIIKRNGISIALLNYTEKLNFHTLPLNRRYCVDTMKENDKKHIKDQIASAKEKADLVIVFPHWGCEYLYEPIDSQKKWALFFGECGADLIIGTHPHVLQYTEDIICSDGRKVPCIYSLGNFISCQVIPGTMLGGMAEIAVTKDTIGRVQVSDYKVIPLVTHTDMEYSFFKTYLLSEYSDELAKDNRIFLKASAAQNAVINKTYLEKLFEDIMTKKAMSYSLFKKPSDVTKYNIKAVFNSVTGKSRK